MIMIFEVIKDFFKLFSRKLVPLYIWFFLYSFTIDLNDNFFICSYLRSNLFGNEEVTEVIYITFSILIAYLFCRNNINLKKLNKIGSDLIAELLKIKYIYIILNYVSSSHVISYNFNKTNMFAIFIFNFYKSYKINNFIVFSYIKFINNLIIWYPIFKTYSIYGFYKTTRVNFFQSKLESVKRLKY